MQKVLGTHKVGDVTTAVLECGHEVPYSQVKWPEGVAECPHKEHTADGKAQGVPSPLPADQTGPQAS